MYQSGYYTPHNLNPALSSSRLWRFNYAERLVTNTLTERRKMTSVFVRECVCVCVCVCALADTVPNAAAFFPYYVTNLCYIMTVQ